MGTTTDGQTEASGPAPAELEGNQTGDPAGGSAPGPSRMGGVGTGVITVVAVIGLVLGTLLGWLAFGASTPGDDSVEAGFARDMAEHHAQAVEMSLEVLQTTNDQGLRALATDIASTQGNQLGQMEGWIRQWDLPMARPGDRMDWMAGGMEHSMHMVEGAPMAGMANPEQMESLRNAEGDAADVLYLQLMITHHIAGVEMAQAALDGGVDGEVERLAAAMVNGQEAEIDLMLGMLQERGEQSQEESGITAGVAEQGAPVDHPEGHGADGPGESDGASGHDGH